MWVRKPQRSGRPRWMRSIESDLRELHAGGGKRISWYRSGQVGPAVDGHGKSRHWSNPQIGGPRRGVAGVLEHANRLLRIRSPVHVLAQRLDDERNIDALADGYNPRNKYGTLAIVGRRAQS